MPIIFYVMDIQTPKNLAEWFINECVQLPDLPLMPKSALKQINIHINVRSLRPETEN